MNRRIPTNDARHLCNSRMNFRFGEFAARLHPRRLSASLQMALAAKRRVKAMSPAILQLPRRMKVCLSQISPG